MLARLVSKLLISGDPPTSGSQSAEITGFHHFGQASLQVLTSGDLFASASKSAGITDQEIPRRSSPTGHQCGCLGRRGCFAGALARRFSTQTPLVCVPF
ncbi:hypothetical protein AAY473_037834 [Plecturocebus cupreus]